MAELTHYIFVEIVESKNLSQFRGKVGHVCAELMGLGKQVLDIKYSRTNDSAMVLYKENFKWQENNSSGVWHPEEEK